MENDENDENDVDRQEETFQDTVENILKYWPVAAISLLIYILLNLKDIISFLNGFPICIQYIGHGYVSELWSVY